MAEQLFPLASANGEIKYFTSDNIRQNKSIWGNKIIIGDTLKVTAKSTPDMSINVAAGTAHNIGYEYRNNASINLAIKANTTTYNRIDAVVIYFSGTSGFTKIIQGTSSANPTSPASAIGTNYIKLADILVGTGVSSIQSANITDTRNLNNQYIVDSLSNEVLMLKNSLYNKRVIEEVRGNPGVRLQADGYCHCYASAIVTQTSGAIDKKLNLSKSFQSDAMINVRIAPATGSEWLNTYVHANFVDSNCNSVRVVCNQTVKGTYAIYIDVIGYIK